MSGQKDVRAIMVLVDNSETSINSDFYPTRLDAQCITINRLALFLFNSNPKSQISIWTTAVGESGIRISFTSEKQRVFNTIQNINIGGSQDIEKAIKSALLAMRHCNSEAKIKRVVCFVSARNNLTKSGCESLLQQIKASDVFVDIFALGSGFTNLDLLKKLVYPPPKANSSKQGIYVEILELQSLLSDVVLSTDVGPGSHLLTPPPYSQLAKTDPAMTKEVLAIAKKPPPKPRTKRQAPIPMVDIRKPLDMPGDSSVPPTNIKTRTRQKKPAQPKTKKTPKKPDDDPPV